MSYDETAVKEGKEETGIELELSKLKLIKKIFQRSVDQATGLINNTIRAQYAYLYSGKL